MNINLLNQLKNQLDSSIIGIEKECLRFKDSNISQSIHPKGLGSSLFNKYITTDFSEAQLEFVTPPVKKKDVLNFLDDIHHFSSFFIDDEKLWPFSMPPFIESEDLIPIANFGTSNRGLLKHKYRQGLAYRYGKMMQSISGIHVNYSFSKTLFENSFLKDYFQKSSDIKSTVYLNMLRNIVRHNWLIIYLFGASPIIAKSQLSDNSNKMIELDKDTLYLPHATSLRMSQYGYCNSLRSNYSVSLYSLENYISDIRNATTIKSEYFCNIEDHNHLNKHQLSENIFQIDDEYYAVARAKNNTILEKRMTSNLRDYGIDFIELRSLDLNPYCQIGIDEHTLNFLELFFLYCFFNLRDPLTKNELNEINYNDSVAAIEGRKKGIQLMNNQNQIALSEWANKIIDELSQLAEILDDDNASHSNSLKKMSTRIKYPEETISSKIIDDILKKNMTFIDYGMELAESVSSFYLERPQSENKNWDILHKESISSLNQQKKLESEKQMPFKEFLDHYYKT